MPKEYTYDSYLDQRYGAEVQWAKGGEYCTIITHDFGDANLEHRMLALRLDVEQLTRLLKVLKRAGRQLEAE